jgi:phosphatidylethanolamine/phosphatidyl-N-methylethanolamine N-methyltransferase
VVVLSVRRDAGNFFDKTVNLAVRAKFLAGFIQQPLATGSLAPSSPHLARMVVDQARLADGDVVLEFGPGTGVFTSHILEQLGPRSKFAAIEINPQFAAIFRTMHPGVPLFEDSVENVRAICDSIDLAAADCIISGLPWAFFSKDMQIRILDQMMRVLRPGGRFIAFGYLHSLALLPAARHLANLLPRYFTAVSRGPIVWRNLPPAFVYNCRR